jgi:hypothetical protein
VITFRIDIVLILPDDEAIAPKPDEGEQSNKEVCCP